MQKVVLRNLYTLTFHVRNQLRAKNFSGSGEGNWFLRARFAKISTLVYLFNGLGRFERFLNIFGKVLSGFGSHWVLERIRKRTSPDQLLQTQLTVGFHKAGHQFHSPTHWGFTFPTCCNLLPLAALATSAWDNLIELTVWRLQGCQLVSAPNRPFSSFSPHVFLVFLSFRLCLRSFMIWS